MRGVLPYIPVVLLSTVALLHSFFLAESNLTRWKGGGFGMFSTIDSPSNRFLICYLLTRGELGELIETPIRVPKLSKLKHLKRAAQTMPRTEVLEDLASELLDVDWYATGARHASDDPAIVKLIIAHMRESEAERYDAKRVVPEGVRLEVWRVNWNLVEGTAARELLSVITTNRSTTRTAACGNGEPCSNTGGVSQH